MPNLPEKSPKKTGAPLKRMGVTVVLGAKVWRSGKSITKRSRDKTPTVDVRLCLGIVSDAPQQGMPHLRPEQRGSCLPLLRHFPHKYFFFPWYVPKGSTYLPRKSADYPPHKLVANLATKEEPCTGLTSLSRLLTAPLRRDINLLVSAMFRQALQSTSSHRALLPFKIHIQPKSHLRKQAGALWAPLGSTGRPAS